MVIFQGGKGGLGILPFVDPPHLETFTNGEDLQMVIFLGLLFPLGLCFFPDLDLTGSSTRGVGSSLNLVMMVQPISFLTSRGTVEGSALFMFAAGTLRNEVKPDSIFFTDFSFRLETTARGRFGARVSHCCGGSCENGLAASLNISSLLLRSTFEATSCLPLVMNSFRASLALCAAARFAD